VEMKFVKIWVIVIVTMFVLFIFLRMMHGRKSGIVKPHQEYKNTIIHVTREFSPIVSYGGLGPVIGSIAKYQSLDLENECFVILPYYSSLPRNFEKFKDFSVQYGTNIMSVPVYVMNSGNIRLFLLGNGDKSPFDHMWEVTKNNLYATASDITSTLRESYFNLLAAKIVKKIATSRMSRNVTVHIHGSTNAIVVPLVHQYFAPTRRPAIVYTMHDYNSEPVFFMILIYLVDNGDQGRLKDVSY
jgi:glycogen synthase